MKTLGMRASDIVASTVGSWKFIIIQSVILIIWMTMNCLKDVFHWDQYPFILLNLVLSFQAAFTAPIIMMAQNRQNDQDRKKMEKDYHINIRAEKEISELHTKIDLLKEKEIKELLDIIKVLVEKS